MIIIVDRRQGTVVSTRMSIEPVFCIFVSVYTSQLWRLRCSKSPDRDSPEDMKLQQVISSKTWWFETFVSSIQKSEQAMESRTTYGLFTSFSRVPIRVKVTGWTDFIRKNKTKKIRKRIGNDLDMHDVIDMLHRLPCIAFRPLLKAYMDWQKRYFASP